MSALTVLCVVGAMFIVVACFGAGVLSLAIRSCARTTFFDRSTAARAAITFAPAIIATLVCVAVISAAQLGGCHCANHDLHHPHLCLAHPLLSQPLFAAAAWILGGWAVLVLPRLVALGRRVIASSHWTRTARRVAPRLVDGIAVRLVDCSDRIAFTIGARSPMIVIDRQLWTALSDEQRRAVVHHEAAHATRRDGLTLLALRLAGALIPLAAAEPLIARWSAAAEMCCDRHAAHMLGDEAVVAEALITVERARTQRTATEAHSFAMAMASHGSIEPRVMALLDDTGRRHDPSALANDLLAIGLLAVAAAFTTWIWPGDTVHHGVETLTGLFSHLL